MLRRLTEGFLDQVVDFFKGLSECEVSEMALADVEKFGSGPAVFEGEEFLGRGDAVVDAGGDDGALSVAEGNAMEGESKDGRSLPDPRVQSPGRGGGGAW